MALPPDIDQRIAKARASGFTDEQIRADIQRKYGVQYAGSSPASAASPSEKAPSFLRRLASPRSLMAMATGGTPGVVAGIGQAVGGGLVKNAKKIGDFLGISAPAEAAGYGLAVNSKDYKGMENSHQNLLEMADRTLQRARQLPKDDPRRKQLMDQSRDAYQSVGQDATAIVDQAPTTRQVIGGLVNTAGLLAGAGVLSGAAKTGHLAAKAIPITLRRAALQAGAEGALTAGGSKYAKGGSAGDVAKSALTGAGVAAGTVGLLGLLARAFTHTAKRVPEALYKTSTRLPHEADAEYLIRQNVVGSRPAMRQKAGALLQQLEGQLEAMPAMRTGAASIDDIMSDAGVQKILDQADRLGEGDRIREAIRKVLPKTPDVVAEVVPSNLKVLEDRINELSVKSGLSAAEQQELRSITEKYVNSTRRFPLLEALKQKRAIDETTAPGVFADRSSSLVAKGENAVADALRRAMSANAPESRAILAKEQPLAQLLNELRVYEQAKTGQFPGSLGNLFQRTLGQPALATRAAREMYRFGYRPAAFLGETLLPEGVRQVLRAALIGLATRSQ